MNYNWPDRIKLVLVNIVLNTIIGIAIALIILFQDSAKQYFTSLKQMFFVGMLLSVLLTLPIFLYFWKQLRRQEDSGELPNMQDMKNITPRQMIFLAIGAPLFVTSIVLYQLYSKLAGVVCFISFLVIWGLEVVYVKKRYKNLDKKHK